MAGATSPTQKAPAAVPGQPQITDAVLGGLEPHDPGANTFVPPGEQQQGALNQLFGYSQSADPFFNVGLAQQMGTAGGAYLDPTQSTAYQKLLQPTVSGAYLDPMNNPVFQRLANAREGIARQMFGEFAPTRSGASVAAGTPYSSSARLAEVQRGGERIGTQAAQDIAQAGWGQYAAERGSQEAARARAYAQYAQERQFQEQAAKYGTQLAPGLAQSVFTGNETLRSQEQLANEDAVKASLVAQGLDNESINSAINFMRNQQAATITGPSPLQTGLDYATGIQGLLQGSGITLADLARVFGIGNVNTPESQPVSGQSPSTMRQVDPYDWTPTNADLYGAGASPYNTPPWIDPNLNPQNWE